MKLPVATNLYYVLREHRGHETGIAFTMDLLAWVDVCNVDKQVLVKGINSGFRDFEDAVQSSAAAANRLDAIISRNKREFEASGVPVLEPEEASRRYVSHSGPTE